MDACLFAERPDGSERREGWGNRSCRWNRVCVTVPADSEGRLVIGIHVPKQWIEATDRAWFRGLVVRQNYVAR